jgi:hypothetical protein
MVDRCGLTPCTDDFSGEDEFPIIVSYTSKAVDEKNATSESKERAEEDSPSRPSNQGWNGLTDCTSNKSSDTHWYDSSSGEDGRVVKNVLEVSCNPELNDSEPTLHRDYKLASRL